MNFEELTLKELELYKAKNKDYTGNQGDPYGNFNRVSLILSLYPKLKIYSPRVIAMVYLLKQLDACCNMLSMGYDGKVEGIKDRLMDISIYAKILILLSEKNNDR